LNTLYCLEEWRGEEIISTPGDNFTLRGQNSPLGDNFAPGVKDLCRLTMPHDKYHLYTQKVFKKLPPYIYPGGIKYHDP
jgi:hypothetical protein